MIENNMPSKWHIGMRYLLIPAKLDFKTKFIRSDKEDHHMLIKRTIHQKNATKLQKDEICLNITNAIYDKPLRNIIINREN
jgi:hypothetical protein